MKLEEYHLILEPGAGWEFPNVKLDRINLVVGDSGTGKSRFINTICNFSLQAISNQVTCLGDWVVKFLVNGKHYKWSIKVDHETGNNEPIVESEELVELLENEEKELVKRSKGVFLFKGKELPKLSKNMTSISILKEEAGIADIYDGFKNIITRRFYNDELLINFNLITLRSDIVDKYKVSKKLDGLIHENIGFHNKIFLLREIVPEKYQQLINFYTEVFPFIERFDLLNPSDLPGSSTNGLRTKVFCFKERNLDKWIPVNDISSGMQKVFLIALDLFLLPQGGIMLIDEYENSLGINAINAFPDLIIKTNINWQFIISSHHPYIINSIPIENWYVFNRRGTKVSIKTGEKLKEKFGKSRQEHFIQLINDPFFKDGIA